MRNLFVALILGICLAAINVIPYPRHVESGSETLEFSRCDLSLESFLDEDFAEILEVHKGIILGDQKSCQSDAPRLLTVRIQQRETVSGSECTAEEYELEVDKQGITVKSTCPVGLVRALATLEQLIQKDDESSTGKVVIEDVPLRIKDEPRFGYRGIMMDSARHFLKRSTIKAIIDGMMLAKLNVLHWHITDDDSFAMESKRIPGLVEDAAFDKNEVYSAVQIKNFVKYAKTRGVRIVPEIESPGHVRAIGKYKPMNDAITCFNSVWPHNLREYHKIRGGPPTAAFDPSMNKSYEFMRAVLEDVVEYFEDDLIHLGGDEVMYSCWRARQSIMDFMKKQGFTRVQQLLDYFIGRTRNILKELNSKKKVVYWSNRDTMNAKIKYAPGDVLQFWGHSSEIHRLEAEYPDNKFILSPYDILYLDCGVGNKYGGPSWCGNYKVWLDIYRFEPTDHNVPESKILGAEGAAWAEQIDDSNIELKFWPRLLPLAETLWMPKRTGPMDLVSLIKRMNAFSKKLNEKGIPSNAFVRQYCEIHTEECFAKRD